MGGMLGAPFMGELIRTCTTMFRLGWNERNGGNISVLVDEEEAAKYLEGEEGTRPVELAPDIDTAELEGRILAVTRTGSYFRNIEVDPERNLGLIRIRRGGGSIIWGFSGGEGPTSELSSHLRSHAVRLRRDKEHRAVVHCHPVNTLAMTFVHELTDRAFTRTLWKMMTECMIVFPEGVGVLPWMICGNDEIGRA
ncbi:MAG: rhamnulose-1-phosphate aldolase, partial [Treponema sp.]|nr:rhamnulose-1-phosphate aldolase [Treponema sp.]